MTTIINTTNDFALYEKKFTEKYGEDYSISFDWGDIDETFRMLGHVESVNPADVVSTQDELNEDTFAAYAESREYDGAYGIRFDGSDEVLVVDGNHRIAAALENEEASVNMIIITL